MKNRVIFGYCYDGTILARKLYDDKSCVFWGFADNSIYKQGYFAYGYPIRSVEKLKQLDEKIGVSVIIASRSYKDIIKQLEDFNIDVEGVYIDGKIHEYPFAMFEKLDLRKPIKLYAGDICDSVHLGDPDLVGLSINRWDEKHIYHDIRNPYPLPDNSVFGYEAEEVFEYIERTELSSVINEIYRVLRPNGCFRCSMPDYNSPYIKRRSMQDDNGKVIFDAGGGGDYNSNGIVAGQVYFATYEDFSELLSKTYFSKINWLCFYTRDGKLHKKDIDMKNGYLNRVKKGSEDFCIVVDCYK